MEEKKSQKIRATNKSGGKRGKNDFLVVGIGASAGGVKALKTFFENVAPDSDMAYVVILHLSPDHDSRLAEILQTVAPIPVKQVKKKVKVKPNNVYVVPPNKSLTMRDGSIVVSPIHTVEERRAPVDIFFRILAESHDGRSVAVILSGTGANGSIGIKRVKERGGAVFVQNPDEAEFSSMPLNSIATEFVDEVLDVAEIPRKIAAYRKNIGKIVIPHETESREEEQKKALRVQTEPDFSNYKLPAILPGAERRINEDLLTVKQQLEVKIEELSQSNNELQNLISSTRIGTILLDRESRVKMVTPAAGEIFNFTKADAGRRLFDITHNLEYENLSRDVETVLEELQPIEREVGARNGNVYLMQVTPYQTAEDRINGTVIAFTNITKAKQREKGLRQSLVHLRLATDAMQIGWGFWDLQTGAAEWDERGKQIIGLADDESQKAQGWLNRVHPEDLPKVEAHVAECLEENKDFNLDYRIVRQDGEIRLVQAMGRFTKAQDGTPLTGTGLVIDVTERRQAEESGWRAEERLQMAMEAGQVIWWEMNPETRDFSFSENVETVLGFRLPAQIIENPFNRIHPEDAQEAASKMLQAVETGEPYEDTIRFVNPETGETVWIHSQGGLIDAADGKKCFVGVAQNFTERKRAEKALRESEERLRLIIRSIEDYAIITLDTDGIINGWNTGAEKMFGYSNAEILGQHTAILFTPEDRAKNEPEKEMTTAAETGKAEDERWHIRQDGSRFYVSGVLQPLKDGNINGFVKIARNLTQRLEAEKNARDKEVLQKLVGAQEAERKRIARDLHDELGQQLVALRLKLETTRKLCADNEELCAGISDAQALAERVDNGVDFLAWELRPVALDDLGLVAALEKYVAEWSRFSGVTTEFRVAGLKKTRLDAEVETNLYRIAQEALNNVHKYANAKHTGVLLEKRGDKVILIIEDDGKGFNTKRKKIWDKGIGLIGMRERAALVGGSIEIESAPTQGTTIFVRVPYQKEETDG